MMTWRPLVCAGTPKELCDARDCARTASHYLPLREVNAYLCPDHAITLGKAQRIKDGA